MHTLDALPAHLVTPFNGPIPPSNLLDKIARGVAQAKGPIDWPHSLRATRVKLIELSRARAKEQQAIIAEMHSNMDADDSTDPSYQHYPNINIRRPLYRQSSMDFIRAADIREDDDIACVSERLQRNISNSSYHPYSRRTPRSRLSSPTCSPSIINPSTPSSSTLNTLSSLSSAHRILRRTSSNLSSTSASSMSIMSSNSGAALPDPRVQRVRRSDSFYEPLLPPKDLKLAPSIYKEGAKDSSPTAGVKRAPSFGALAQRDREVFGVVPVTGKTPTTDYATYPSSDEEEKIRAKGAKKMRVKDLGSLAAAGSISAGIPPTSPPAVRSSKRPKKSPAVPDSTSKSQAPKIKKRNIVTQDSPDGNNKLKASPSSIDSPAPVKERTRSRPTPMNLQRNPSIFGAELPHLRGVSASPTLSPPPEPSRTRLHSLPALLGSPEPSPQKVRTLRRVQRMTLGRRISFGSLVSPGEDADAELEPDDDDSRGLRRERQRQRELGQLGSAFQLV
ncbi:hypothetical protein H0H81_010055 [Sphagnurus paluster]|uniref:Uncharacterized protein n=1 Tax=Sphagnurus paluster TaxID=117069 RepID=A0A9P7FP60_9AGAR|nr:hypothetical protein H0H81_010055 [Sphagnurus paluster]